MEDIRSNPEEESLEAPEAREEVEALDQTTNEAEAYVEKTRSYAEAEAIEGALVEMVKGSPDTIEQTAPPGTSDAGIEKIEAKDDKDEVTPINLPSPKDSQIAASPLTIPQDVSEVADGTASVSMEAPDPGPHPPPELEEEESTLWTAPSEMPSEMDKSGETVGLKWDESAMVKGSEEEIEGTPINQPREIAMDEEPPHSLEANEVGSAAGSVAKEDPSPDPTPPDREGMQVLEEEAILREAPTEMPPEMDRLESDEVVGFKFFKPVPAEEDLSAMVKGEMDLQEGMSVELEGSGPEPHLGGIGKDPSDEGGGADPDLSVIGKQPEGGGGGDGGGDPDLGGIGKEPDGGGSGPDPDIHKAGMDPDPVD